jgi:hypothetical protein
MAVPAEHLFTPAGSAHAGRPSLLVRYRSLGDVRRAIDDLEAHGVDGDHLTLVGRDGELPHVASRRRSDSRFLSHTMLLLAAGVICGALAGAVVGAALVGLVLLVRSGLEASGWIFALITVWFAAGGAVLGCFFAVSRAVGFSESWPLTFEDETAGPVWLAVYEGIDDPEAMAERTRALEIVTDPVVEVSHESATGSA